MFSVIVHNFAFHALLKMDAEVNRVIFSCFDLICQTCGKAVRLFVLDLHIDKMFTSHILCKVMCLSAAV